MSCPALLLWDLSRGRGGWCHTHPWSLRSFPRSPGSCLLYPSAGALHCFAHPPLGCLLALPDELSR